MIITIINIVKIILKIESGTKKNEINPNSAKILIVSQLLGQI